MRTYRQYINEGVKDMMTPKSREEISNVLNNMTYKEYRNAILTKKHTFRRITFNLGLLLGANIKNKEKYLKKISSGYRTHRLPDKVGQELAKELYYSWYLGESIRDKMTPKSGEEIDLIAKERLPKIIEEIADDLMASGDYDKIGPEKVRRVLVKNKGYIVDKISDNYTVNQISAIFYMNKDRLIYESREEKSYEDTNESVRDKMTPRSGEDIDTRLRDLPYKDLMNLLMDAVVDDDADIVETVFKHIRRDFKYCKEMAETAISFGNKRIIRMFLDKGMPKDVLLYLYGYAYERQAYDVADLIKKYIHVNEGVRAMMTPKSKDDIDKNMLRSNRKPHEIFIYSCESGYMDGVIHALSLPNNEINRTIINWGLRRSAWNGSLEIVRYLIEEKNADVHDTNDFAFREACENGDVAMVEYLISKGADIYVNDGEYIKWRLTMRNATEGQSAVLRVLKEQDKKNRMG